MTTTTASPAPVRETDLLGIRIAHRIMRHESRRLGALAARWAAEPSDARRRAVLVRWALGLCDDVHHHHATEDDVLWPVLERRAGPEVDLGPLSDDHAALDPVLEVIREAARRVAADGRDPAADALAVLGERLTHLADVLDEHIVEEERELFPIILRYVPAEDWTTVEKAAQSGGAGLRFVVPRILAHATADERATILGAAPLVLRLVARLLLPRYRREERLLFGA